MQLTNIALSLALTSTLIYAAPVQVEKRQEVVDKRLPLNDLTQARNALIIQKRLNAAAMIGLTAGAIAKGIFGSKEAADEFLATEEGKDFASKFETRDVDISHEKRLNNAGRIGLAVTGASGLYSGLKWLASQKEAISARNSVDNFDLLG